ncbi:MAG: ABC transporter ATP-binding protein [Thermoplasmatota archaeon]
MVLEEVHKSYKMGESTVYALRGVSISVKQGEYMSITGPSGSGKTTLMNMIGALDRPSKGRVLIDGRDITSMGEGQLSRIRLLNFGFVFQQFYLLPTLTSFENVYLPIKESRKYGTNGRDRALELLDRVGMRERARHLPSQLSGGEQQRISVARALANDPSCILADEPTGELDSENTKNIMDLLRNLNREMGKTLIIVTHDPEIAKRSKRTVRLKDGRIT